MPESENKSNNQSTVPPQRQKFRYRLCLGMLLMNLGIVFTTMKTMNHLKQQPQEPLGFDLTLRYGDGGFIAYGVAVAVLGFVLIGMDYRRRKGK